ncbi:MAG: DNA primase [Planctomycetes bacterium]|nr:DNA primase [Planctomycetota bacterium]
MISPDQIESIRQATDIVELVSRYLLLKPSGRNFVAVCPFHREKTPSFNVNPERQIFKCFGCQAAGDVFRFVMQMENVTFPEAARMLAERAGIRLEAATGGDRDRLDRERLAEALAFAAALYAKTLLREAAGAPGRAYLERRGVLPELAREWGLGYAPDDRGYLVSRARREGFTPDELEKAGLSYPAREGAPGGDRFLERVMFPIHNAREQIAGFGGRAVREDQKAKYINSAEGPLFQKSRLLYGLHRVQRARRDPDFRAAPYYVAEGYLDVMALHAAGVRTAVAPLGTALTAEQARILRAAGTGVVLVFDGDEAGEAASRRAIAELVRQDVDVHVTRPTPGRDPFSIFEEDGPAILRSVVDCTVSAYQFLLGRALARHGDTVEGRAATAGDLADVLGQTVNPMKEEGYIRQAAFDLRTDAAALRRVWRERRSGRPVPASPVAAAGQTVHGDGDTKAELDLALALIGRPELVGEAVARIPLERLRDPRVRAVVGVFYDLEEERRGVDPARVLDRLQSEQDQAARELATDLILEADRRWRMREEGRTDRDRDPFADLLAGFLDHLARREARAHRERLMAGLREAVARADPRAVDDNLAALSEAYRTGPQDGGPSGAVPCGPPIRVAEAEGREGPSRAEDSLVG